VRGTRGALAALVIGAVVLVGCGSAGIRASTPRGTAAASPTPNDQTALPGALAAWADFPVNASPRPLVLPGGDDEIVGSGVYSGDQKIAFGEGAIDPLPTLTSSPTEAGGYRLITAGQAFQELSRGNGQSPSPTRIQTTSATLGSTGFETDRGVRQLPAWVFTFAGISGWRAVLAVAPASIYPLPAPLSTPPGVQSPGDVQLAADGRTLTVDTGGALEGTGPCQAQYSLQVASSESAVAIAVLVRMNPVPSGTICAVQAVPFQLTAVLASPLGGRVVVNTQAQPIEVAEAS
jgi:hypothetical protein